MLRKSGFVGADKPRHWQKIQKQLKNLYSSKKDIVLCQLNELSLAKLFQFPFLLLSLQDHHRTKPWLTKRDFNYRMGFCCFPGRRWQLFDKRRIDAHRWLGAYSDI